MGKKKYDLFLLNEKYGKDIIQEYNKGAYVSDLSLKYLGNKRDYRYINYLLELNKIPLRTRSEVKRLSDKKNKNPHLNGRVFSVNSDYFKTWSHNMAYILGYIATDGCVNGERALKFGLQTLDVSLLEKIKKEMNFTGNIYERKILVKGKEYFSNYMSIYDREICKDLKNLGIISNKSLVLGRFDFIPEEYEMSFLLGVFDGDGSISLSTALNYNNIQIRLRYFSASLDFITYIRDIMLKHGYTNAKIVNDIRKRKHSFYSLCYSTKDSLKFYQEAYSNCSIWIDRKKEKFDKLIKLRKEYEEQKENKNILKVTVD